ncbi:hypothetical protein [Streptomyces sp. AA1529]
MAKKITIIDTHGMTQAETTARDNEAARYYENLPFESDNVARVDVTDTDD